VSHNTGLVTSAAFSPDGRFVAYEIDPSVPGQPSRIFLIPAQGGESSQVYEEMRPPEYKGNDRLRLLDWTADGRFLAIASQRAGKGALHLLPVRDGKATGAPQFVQFGEFESAFITSRGGLTYWSRKPESFWAVYLAPLDLGGHPGDWKRLDPPAAGRGYPQPSWSSDSNQIVYVTSNGEGDIGGTSVVHLYSLLAGTDREIYRAPGYILCVLANQHPNLFCSATTHETKILSISVESGTIALLHTVPASPLGHYIAYTDDDDRGIYIYEVDPLKWKILRWDIGTQQSSVSEFAASAVPYTVHQQWLVRRDRQTLDVRPRSGGEWRTVVHLSTHLKPAAVVSCFSPDGKWLYYRDLDSAGKASLFRVSIPSGTPERLGDLPATGLGGGIRISPNGSNIVFSAMDPAPGELYLLENFVPMESKR